MDALPSLIIKLGPLLCGPDYNRHCVIAALDALGVLFLSNSHTLGQNAVELSWLRLRAPSMVKVALDVIGEDWQTEVPYAAAVLATALQHGCNAVPRSWGVVSSQVLPSV